MTKEEKNKTELEKYKERRINLFINISLALIIGITSSIFTINFINIDSWFFKTIYLFIGAIGIVFFIFIIFLLIFKDFFGKELVLFKPKKEDTKLVLVLRDIQKYLFFLIPLLLFFGLVEILDNLAHSLLVAFSLFVSAVIIVFIEKIFKKDYNNTMRMLSIFFFIACITLVISIFIFSNLNQEKGKNLEKLNVSLEIYVINNAIEKENALEYFYMANKMWNDYNISLNLIDLNYYEVNLTKDETHFLFQKGNNEEECKNYSIIMDKIIQNRTNLKLIFLDDFNSGKKGRGCLCNCSFVLVSQEKFLFKDFTGWDLAHEIGHILGLTDIECKGRVIKNLMNDEHKKLFFSSNYLSQSQVDIVVNTTKKLNKFD